MGNHQDNFAGFEIVVGAGMPSEESRGGGRPSKPHRASNPSPATVPEEDAATVDWDTTRALSIRQPFAEQVIRGVKPFEYRSQPTRIRGRIAIYASRGRWGSDEEADFEQECGFPVDPLPRGVLIGTVDLYDCLADDGSSGYAWALKNPRRFKTPIRPLARPQPVWFYPFRQP